MLSKEKKLVEKICEIPVTLGDVSESIFGGVSTKNSLLHRLLLPEEGGPDSFYLCEGLCKPVFIESELVHPYVSGAFSDKFTFCPAPYSFMLPYELSDGSKKKEYKAIPSEKLKVRFPMAYRRIAEFKKEFLHDTSPINSADYSVKGNKFMEYFNTPKIIATESYHMQAAYDAVGNHVFEEGCGIVLKDPSKYPYVTSVLNSPIARIFPLVCKYEMMYSSVSIPSVIKRFPILFPDNCLTEELIDTIYSYLVFLKKQKYSTEYGDTEWFKELVAFYEQISTLLILDTYFINDLDPRLLEVFEENIHPYAGDIESESSESLLNALYYIKRQILGTSSFGKYIFGMGLPGTLSFP